MTQVPHKADVPRKLSVGILTVSTTRSLKEDKSGHWMARRAEREGHRVVAHHLVPDAATSIAEALNIIIDAHQPHAVLVTSAGEMPVPPVTRTAWGWWASIMLFRASAIDVAASGTWWWATTRWPARSARLAIQ